MFDLFSRARRSCRPNRPSFRPSLEKLEQRDCPTAISLTAYVMSTTKSVTFMGQVTGAMNPGGMSVTLSGVAAGSTVTDANGNFQIQLTATGLGAETATTTGASASYTVADPGAPLIDLFTSEEYAGGYYLFSGHVQGTVVPGEQITFGGGIPTMQGQTTTVDSNGNFSYVGHLLPNEDGTVTATATADAWGVNNTASNSVDQLL